MLTLIQWEIQGRRACAPSLSHELARKLSPGMGWGGRPGCPVGTSAPVVVGVIRSACLAAGRPDLPVVASWVVVVLAWSLGRPEPPPSLGLGALLVLRPRHCNALVRVSVHRLKHYCVS